MKTATRGDYLAAKRRMIESPTLDNVMRYVEVTEAFKGRLPIAYYHIANMYLKKCP